MQAIRRIRRGGPAGRSPRRAPPASAGWLPKSVRDMSTLERRLANAGYRSDRPPPRLFSVAEFGVPAVLVLAVVALVGSAWTGPERWIAAGFARCRRYLLPGFSSTAR